MSNILATQANQIDKDLRKELYDQAWSQGSRCMLAKQLPIIYKKIDLAVENEQLTEEQAQFIKTDILPAMPKTRTKKSIEAQIEKLKEQIEKKQEQLAKQSLKEQSN